MKNSVDPDKKPADLDLYSFQKTVQNLEKLSSSWVHLVKLGNTEISVFKIFILGGIL